MRQEGEHVGVGQVLARVYANDGALQTVSQIETLQLQLQQLQFALTSYLDPDAALKLDTSITGDILTLRQSLTGGDYTAAESDIAQLKAAVLKRDHPYTSQEEIQTEIKSVEGQIQSLENSLSGAATVTAKSSGTYSAVCDGYETVLTTEFLEDVTPVKLAKLQPSGEDSNIGKLIYGDTWYYVVTLAGGAGQCDQGAEQRDAAVRQGLRPGPADAGGVRVRGGERAGGGDAVLPGSIWPRPRCCAIRRRTSSCGPTRGCGCRPTRCGSAATASPAYTAWTASLRRSGR